jgi:hypothetical protein
VRGKANKRQQIRFIRNTPTNGSPPRCHLVSYSSKVSWITGRRVSAMRSDMLTRRNCKPLELQLRHLQCSGYSKCSVSPGWLYSRCCRYLKSAGKSIKDVVFWGLRNLLPCSVGDLNPILGFCFPLFSMSFGRELPSEWKTKESSGNKIVVKL